MGLPCYDPCLLASLLSLGLGVFTQVLLHPATQGGPPTLACSPRLWPTWLITPAQKSFLSLPFETKWKRGVGIVSGVPFPIHHVLNLVFSWSNTESEGSQRLLWG